MTKKNQTYSDLADWAEHDMALTPDSETALRGDAAAEAGRALLERVAGRPALAQGEGESPRRQVRLPKTLSDEVDRIAAEQHRRSSEVMRDAIRDYAAKYGHAIRPDTAAAQTKTKTKTKAQAKEKERTTA